MVESATVSSAEKTSLLDQIVRVLGTIFTMVVQSPIVQNALNSTSTLQPSPTPPIVIQVSTLADNFSSTSSSLISQTDYVSQNDTVLQSVTEVQGQTSDMTTDDTIYLNQDNGTEVNQNGTEGMGQQGEPVVQVTDQPYVDTTSYTEDIVNQTTNSSSSIQQFGQTNVSEQQDLQGGTVNQTAAVPQLTQSMNQSANMTANSNQTVTTVENSTETFNSTSGDLIQTVAVQQQGQVSSNATQYDFNFTSTASNWTIQQQNLTGPLFPNQSLSTISPIVDNSTSTDGLIQATSDQQQSQTPPNSNQILNDPVLSDSTENPTDITATTLSNQQLSVQLLHDLKTVLSNFLNALRNSTSTTSAPSAF